MRLESRNYEVFTAANGKDALGKLDLLRPDVVVTDLRMDKMGGIEFYKAARSQAPYLPFIIMTAHGTIPEAVKATQEGIFAYITKPIDKDEFLDAVQNALKVSGGLESANPDEGDVWKKNLISRSPTISEVINKARLICDNHIRILITGESGTGKETLARTIHEASKKASGPFVSVNASVLTEEVLEKEVLPRAQNGTLFLNEISDLSQGLQANLLRLLRPYESERDEVPKIRLISSSITDLKEAMKAGRFREDLFYSLSVVSFHLPSMEQRREDIPLLARYFLKNIATEQHSNVREFAPEALRVISEGEWPGNIRQLYHTIQQLVALSTTTIVTANLTEKALDDNRFEVLAFSEARSQFERDYLIKLLKLTEGNVSQAARSAKRNRTDFYKLLARNNIDPSMLKQSLFRRPTPLSP